MGDGAEQGQTAARGGAVLVVRFAVIALLNYTLSVVLAWLLPPEQFGLVSVIQATFLLAALMLNSGFPWSLALSEAKRTLADSDRADAVFRSSVLGNLAFGALLGVGVIILEAMGVRILPDGGPWLVWVVVSAFPVFALNAVLKGALHGHNRFSDYGLVQAVEVVVKCLVAVALVTWLGAGGSAVAVAFLVGALVAAAVALWKSRDLAPRTGPLAEFSAFRDAGPMFVGTAAFALFTTADILGLQIVGSGFGVTAASLAVYQVAVLLARAPYYVADALSDAVFPFIARRQGSATASHRWFGAAARWILLIVVPLELVMVVRPEPLLAAFFPAEYADSALLVRLLGIGAVGMVACGTFGKSLQALGRQDLYARTMPAVLLVEATVLAVLVPQVGATGAAVAFLVAAWTGAVSLAVAYHRHQGRLLPPAATVVRYGASLAALAAVLLVLPVDPLPTAVGTVFLAGLVYAAVATAVGILTTSDLLRLWRAIRTGSRRVLDWLVARPRLVVVAMLGPTALLYLLRLSAGPDTQYDEIVYTRAAQSVAAAGDLSWSTEPVLVHPPVYFLLQAGWLRFLGLADAPLLDAITGARLLTAVIAAANAVLVGLLVLAVTHGSDPRRRLSLAVVAVVIAATDPVLLRFGRLAIIDTLALFGILLTLWAAWAARRWDATRHVLVIGLLTGVTVLVKEIAAFLLLAPLLYAVLSQDRRYARRALGALTLAGAMWLLFPLWAVRLGVTDRFAEVKTLTLERLLGKLQITGWNRPGVSMVDAMVRSATQYASSYIVLALGAVALLWLLFRRNGSAASWVMAMLLCAYGFGVYIVVQGTLNEQFFVYIIAPAVVGAVVALDAFLVTAWNRARGRNLRSRSLSYALGVAGVGGVALLVVASGSAYATQYLQGRNDGIAQMVAYVTTRFPRCEAFNSSGDPQKYLYTLGGRTVTRYGSGPGALAHGVHYFFLSEKDVLGRYGAMSPDLASWIRERGSLVTAFPSRTHGGVALWQVPGDEYDATADVEAIPGGVFVHNGASRCGGFSVRDGAGAFLYGYRALGGKEVVGAPSSRPWRVGNRWYQAFHGVILRSEATTRPGPAPVRAVPVVTMLAARAPSVYVAYRLPPVAYDATATITPKQVLRRLDDVRIASAYLGVPKERVDARRISWALNHFGAPIGRATTMPDGAVRQAFTNVVMERQPTAPDVVRLAPVGQAAVEAFALVPARAARPEASPPLVLPTPPAAPSEVEPFASSLLVVLGAGLLLVSGSVVGRMLLHRQRPRRQGGARRREGAVVKR